MSHENDLREALFRAEPVNTERQQRFRDELAQIMEPRLSRCYRLYYTVSLVGLVAGLPGAACGVLFDGEHRWIWALGLLGCSVFAGWTFYILRRNTEPLRIMQGMSKVFTGLSAVVAGFLIFQGLQGPSLSNVFWALLGLLVFLLASFINLWNRVIVTERTMREHILRVEYRLADLNQSAH